MTTLEEGRKAIPDGKRIKQATPIPGKKIKTAGELIEYLKQFPSETLLEDSALGDKDGIEVNIKWEIKEDIKDIICFERPE